MKLRDLIYSADLSNATKYRLLSIIEGEDWVEEMVGLISELDSQLNDAKEEVREINEKLKEAREEAQDKIRIGRIVLP